MQNCVVKLWGGEKSENKTPPNGERRVLGSGQDGKPVD